MPGEANLKGSRNVSNLIKGLSTADERLLQGAEQALNKGFLYAVGLAQTEGLSGPRPTKLDVVTTRLRNSITHKVWRTARGVTGSMGSNVKYGAYHEFGFRGVEQVKGHTRVVNQTNAKGEAVDTRRPIRDRAGVLIGYKESRRQAAAKQKAGTVGVQYVKAHPRRVNYAGRPYVRPALKKAQPVMRDLVKKKLEELKPHGNANS
jgi:phage gpG-like protein